MAGSGAASGAKGYWWAIVVYVLVGAGLAGIPDPSQSADANFPWTATHLLGVSRATAAGVGSPDQLSFAQLAFFATSGEVPARVAERLDYGGSPQTLADQVEVTADRDSGALRITNIQDDPDRAVAVADAFAEELVNYLAERDAVLQQDRLDAGLERLDRLEAELARAEAQAFANPSDVVALTEFDGLRLQYSVTFEQVGLLGSSKVGLVITTLESARAIPVADDGLGAPRSRTGRALAGALAGLAIGVGIALFLARAERKIRSVTEIGELVGAAGPVAAPVVVPDRRRDDMQALVVRHDRHDTLAETYRTLTRIALISLPPHAVAGAPIIVVASPSRSDGRTWVTAEMGAAFAELHPGVIVVNGDFRQPMIAKRLAWTTAPTVGLLDADQLDDAPPELLIQPSDVAGLSLIDLHGTSRLDPSETARATARAATRVRRDASAVVIDSAAAIAAAESQELFAIADVIMLVIRIGHTTKSDTSRTIELIRSLTDALVIPVVTGATGELAKYESYVSERTNDAEIASTHA